MVSVVEKAWKENRCIQPCHIRPSFLPGNKGHQGDFVKKPPADNFPAWLPLIPRSWKLKNLLTARSLQRSWGLLNHVHARSAQTPREKRGGVGKTRSPKYGLSHANQRLPKNADTYFGVARFNPCVRTVRLRLRDASQLVAPWPSIDS